MPAFIGALGVGLVAAIAVLIFLMRSAAPRTQARRRLDEVAEGEVETPPITIRTDDVYPPRYRVVPWVLAIIVFAVCLIGQAGLLFSLIAAVIILLLGFQVETAIAERRIMRVEAQLAETIDLTVSALNSGASIINALTYAAGEIGSPLRDYLAEALDRIRLGDQPQTVFRGLSDRIPLDNVRLFITAVTINWEAGGSLGPTLATVGQAIRDRIEVARRIRAMTAASRVSIIIVLALTYFIAFVMWQSDPNQAEAFAASPIGAWLIAIALLLQAIGIVWSNAISRPKS